MGIDSPKLKTFSGREPSQDARELRAFIALLKAEGVRSYGEIGARDGDTFHEVMCSLPDGSKGVALDYPGGPWGNAKTRHKLELAVANLRGRGYNASALFGDSKAPATIKHFRGRGPYDAILIDGDHRLEGVTADWVNYRGMARLIAFHDIVGAGQTDKAGNAVDVHTVWKMICGLGLGYRVQEFVTPGSKMGIGVVWMQT